MASSSKKKTTMAKLTREHRLRERRLEKQARKDARKHAAAEDRDVVADAPDLGMSIGESASVGISTAVVEPAPLPD